MGEHKLPPKLVEIYELNTHIANIIGEIAAYSEIAAGRVDPDYLEILREIHYGMDSEAKEALFRDLEDMYTGKRSAYSDQFKKFAKEQIAHQKETLEELYRKREELKKELKGEVFADDPFISCERLAFSKDGEPIDWRIWDWVPTSNYTKIWQKNNHTISRDINPITGLFEPKAIGGMVVQSGGEDIGRLNYILLLGEATEEERIEAMRKLAKMATPKAIETLAAVLDLNKNKRLFSQYESPESINVVRECVELLGKSGSPQAVNALLSFSEGYWNKNTFPRYSIKGSVALSNIDDALMTLCANPEIREYIAKLYTGGKFRSRIYYLVHPPGLEFLPKGKLEIISLLHNKIFEEINGHQPSRKGIFAPKTAIYAAGNIVGVGFRGTVEEFVDKLWLDLEIKAENLSGSTVKITLKGNSEEVEKFIAWLPSMPIAAFESKGQVNLLWESSKDFIKSWESTTKLIKKGLELIYKQVPLEVFLKSYKLQIASGLPLSQATKDWLKRKVIEKLGDEGLVEEVVKSLVAGVSSGQVEQWAKETSEMAQKKREAWAEISPKAKEEKREKVIKALKEKKNAWVVVIDGELLKNNPGLGWAVISLNQQLGPERAIKWVLDTDISQVDKLYKLISKKTLGLVDLKGQFDLEVDSQDGKKAKEAINYIKKRLEVDRIEVIGRSQLVKDYHEVAKSVEKLLRGYIGLICKLGDENSIYQGDLALHLGVNAILYETGILTQEEIKELDGRLDKEGRFFEVESKEVEEKNQGFVKHYQEVLSSE